MVVLSSCRSSSANSSRPQARLKGSTLGLKTRRQISFSHVPTTRGRAMLQGVPFQARQIRVQEHLLQQRLDLHLMEEQELRHCFNETLTQHRLLHTLLPQHHRCHSIHLCRYPPRRTTPCRPLPNRHNLSLTVGRGLMRMSTRRNRKRRIRHLPLPIPSPAREGTRLSHRLRV